MSIIINHSFKKNCSTNVEKSSKTSNNKRFYCDHVTKYMRTNFICLVKKQIDRSYTRIQQTLARSDLLPNNVKQTMLEYNIIV